MTKLITMFCKNCGKQINENADYCMNCGVKAGTGNKYCANCGAEPDPMAAICVKCGCKLDGKTTKSKESTGKVVDSFGGAITSCFSKYATFSGRANRSEYWYWVLFAFIMGIIPVVNWIAFFALLIPGLAVLVRRLHDTGRSGWWYFIGLIPIVGFIWLLVILCQPSQEGDNEYGANPND